MTGFFSILLCLCLCLCGSVCTVYAEPSFEAYFTYVGTHDVQDANNAQYASQGQTEAYETVWRNESVLFKMAVQGSDTVSLSLTSFDSDTHRMEPVYSFYEMKNVSAGYGIHEDPYVPHRDVPDRLLSCDTLSLNGQVLLMLEIHIPRYAYPDTYTGQVVFTHDNGSTDTCTITLEVTELSVKETPDLDLWQYTYPSFRYYDKFGEGDYFSDAHLEVLRREMQLYRDAGGSAITVPVLEEPWGHQTFDDTPSLITWMYTYDGKLVFDYTNFDKYVEMCMELGIDERIEAFTLLPWDKQFHMHLEWGGMYTEYHDIGSEEWKAVWRDFLNSFIAHLKEKGWFEKTYIFLDERDINEIQAAVQMIEEVTDDEGRHLKIAGAVNHLPLYEIYDHMDYLSLSIALDDLNMAMVNEAVQHRRELGLQTTLYNCSVTYPSSYAISDPAETLLTMDYVAVQSFDGFLRWAFNAYPRDPLLTLDNPSYEAGDVLLIYPDAKDSQDPVPSPSVRLFLIREGLEDMYKYQRLEDAQLQEAYAQIRRGRGTYNAYGAFLVNGETSRAVTISETLRLKQALSEASQRYTAEVYEDYSVLEQDLMQKYRLLRD